MMIMVAGSNTRGVVGQCLKYGVPKLYSMLNEKKEIEKWDHDLFLLVDSGAHTWNKETITKVGMKGKKKLKPAKQFIEEYFEFIKKHGHKKLAFIEFDVYGHLDKEYINEFYYRVQRLKLTAKFIRVYHPILDGDTGDVLRQWVNEGQEYVCIANDSLHMLDKIFSITRDKCRVHGLAITKLKQMEKYPFFSVDSTSPLSTVIFGRYSRPVMGFNERDDIRKANSIECYHEDEERIENAIIEVKKTQDYVTKLWTKKGVTWPNLKW